MAAKTPKGKTPSFTPAVDRRIIEGFFGNRESMLRELARVGFKRVEILNRAAFLGLNKGFVKRFTDVETLSVRRCLRCDGEFLSLGPQNRLCRGCNARD